MKKSRSVRNSIDIIIISLVSFFSLFTEVQLISDLASFFSCKISAFCSIERGMKQGPPYKTYKDDERHSRKRESEYQTKKTGQHLVLYVWGNWEEERFTAIFSLLEEKNQAERESEENKEQKRRSNHHHYTNDMIFSFIQMMNEEKKSKT